MKEIETLEKHFIFFEGAILEVLDVWCAKDVLVQTLEKFGIAPETFRKEYASKIVNYYVDVVAGKSTIGNCPYANKMIDDFKALHMNSSDIFMICSQFKVAFVDVILDADVESKKMLNEMFYLMDRNFQGVLNYYENN
jgi:hypothetical protein